MYVIIRYGIRIIHSENIGVEVTLLNMDQHSHLLEYLGKMLKDRNRILKIIFSEKPSPNTNNYCEKYYFSEKFLFKKL